MIDEYQGLLGGAITVILGWVGWESRKTNTELKELPEKYVLKDDYNRRDDKLDETLKEMRQTIHGGLERIHTRLDGISKE